jgi:4-amino-4-deoxy-L-arabinose transferase-like glycosyltransferase
MTLSWKNFFFGAFDPGGFITVDKPPVFLWIDALSARVFGYSSWSLLLPSAFAGAASVALLWLIVRRYFGALAATVAGAVLAVTPVSVAVNRLNLPEPFMILALVAGAGAVLRSLESRRWWAWLALAGCLVGVAFNTKMLAAWIPGPAFALAIIVAARELSWASARRVAARLAVLGAVTLAVSGSWMVVVDAWPASQRPYIGGSTDNTVLDLALGYNGFGRVEGEGQVGGARTIPAPNTGRRQGGNPGFGPGGGGTPRAGRGGGFAGPGGIFGGVPSVLRMLDDANGGQIGWLLPFALGSALLAAWNWRRDPVRRAFVIAFLGWLLLYAGVFSYARGIFHSYYTSAMAPAVASLAGIGVVAAADLVRRDRRWLIAVLGIIAVTACAQADLAGRTPGFYGWVLPLMLVGVLITGACVAARAIGRQGTSWAMTAAVGALLLLPGAWSVSAAANASLNTTLPQAGPQGGASGGTFGSQAFDDRTPELAAWLDAHRDRNATWQLVVPNAQDASRLIAEDDISVMALGGFLGNDNTISVSGFAGLIAQGKVRYVLVQGAGGGGRFPGAGGRFGFGGFGGFGRSETSGPGAVLFAVAQGCTPVRDGSLPASYQGSLYDCAGRAAQVAHPAG